MVATRFPEECRKVMLLPREPLCSLFMARRAVASDSSKLILPSKNKYYFRRWSGNAVRLSSSKRTKPEAAAAAPPRPGVPRAEFRMGLSRKNSGLWTMALDS